MSNISISLEGIEKNAKFPAGPTMDRPGPMLLIDAITAVKVVTRSCPSNDKAKRETVNTTI